MEEQNSMLRGEGAVRNVVLPLQTMAKMDVRPAEDLTWTVRCQPVLYRNSGSNKSAFLEHQAE